jgi:hypothetical protein
MERTNWADERLDERMAAIDDMFERDSADLRAQREEIRAGLADVHRGFNELGDEIASLRRDMHADIVALQRHMVSVMAGLAVGLLGLLAAAQF